MSKIQIDTMPDLSEIIHYDTPGIPLYIRKGLLSNYPNKRAQCHWHDDIELIYILKGNMNYYINGKTICLNEGEGILINSKEMHYGYAYHDHDCEFICILFHPSILSSCKDIFIKSIMPFLERKDLPYVYFVPSDHQNILKQIKEIWHKKEGHDAFYELQVIGQIYSLLAAILKLTDCVYSKSSSELSSDVLALRKMVSFIHGHYKQDLSLQEIADAANICKSKCCQVFKDQIQQRPFDFLNHYRLQLSADLLKSSTRSITEIALECGFNHLSYYSKLFFKYYNCTPSAYRKKYTSL